MADSPSARTDWSPIAGPGSEVYGWVTGWSWCGFCGYTGRCKGPRQAKCKQWIWHGWLEKCAELERV